MSVSEQDICALMAPVVDISVDRGEILGYEVVTAGWRTDSSAGISEVEAVLRLSQLTSLMPHVGCICRIPVHC